MNIPNDIWERCRYYEYKLEKAEDNLIKLEEGITNILWEMHDVMEFSKDINDMSVYYKLETFYNKFREILEEEL